MCGAVAEWEDAEDLKSSVREDVWVRVPPALPSSLVNAMITLEVRSSEDHSETRCA